ncbi:type II/IV secretion system protein [candidate division WWE3 bacterium]|uniref:Type II/IV secretion system protein n=1 Tax=candidate division WWE3 bacterium TaxID=2053526 RepID=A0A955LGV2_UNCKA|nr:type II/IV secretion system protein [candidate division WWE3 bacterium]
MAERTDLVDILVKNNVINDDQASQIRLDHINTGKELKSIIMERGLAGPKQIVQAEAEILNVEFIDLGVKAISPEILSKIPESVARHYTLIPVGYDGEGKLQVAMKDPLDLQLVEFLETKTGDNIHPMMAEEKSIKDSIAEMYSVGIEKEVRAALKETEKDVKQAEQEIETVDDLRKAVESAPVARIVSTIFEYAIKVKASDVHIEPGEDHTRIRYRIDGILRERLALPRRVHDSVVSRIKILSNLKIDERRVPQDGRTMYEMGDQQVDLRISTLPTTHGEKVVARLLRKTKNVPTLEELGIKGLALKQFKEVIHKPNGIILVTGPTGSGKTTTLRTALSMINTTDINICTLEDPVEYEIAGINQVQTNPQAGLTFASGLRSFLRQDPDVIMVGEIRDSETMELAIQASLTGHLVFSTIHTNSAAGTLPRLLDMGAEPFLLASTMELVLAQRLVRTLCDKCKQPHETAPDETEKVREMLGPLADQYVKSDKITIYKQQGCSECNDTGYVGRMGIYEVLVVTEKVGRLILERETADTIEAEAINNGMLKMLQDGMIKVVEGVTTLEEILRVARE